MITFPMPVKWGHALYYVSTTIINKITPLFFLTSVSNQIIELIFGFVEFVREREKKFRFDERKREKKNATRREKVNLNSISLVAGI